MNHMDLWGSSSPAQAPAHNLHSADSLFSTPRLGGPDSRSTHTTRGIPFDANNVFGPAPHTQIQPSLSQMQLASQSMIRPATQAVCNHMPSCPTVDQHMRRLEDYIAELEVAVQRKDADIKQKDALLAAFQPRMDRLVEAIDALASGAGPARRSGHGPKSASDYPMITYWNKSQWTEEHRRLQRVPKVGGEKKSKAPKEQPWIQYENGDVVSLERLAALRKAIRAGWFAIRQEGKLAATWTGHGDDVLKKFRDSIYDEFPEMELCANHWKLEVLCSAHYPSWYGNYGQSDSSASVIVKEEHDDEDALEQAMDDATPAPTLPTKRGRVDSTVQGESSKRHKTSTSSSSKPASLSSVQRPASAAARFPSDRDHVAPATARSAALAPIPPRPAVPRDSSLESSGSSLESSGRTTADADADHPKQHLSSAQKPSFVLNKARVTRINPLSSYTGIGSEHMEKGPSNPNVVLLSELVTLSDTGTTTLMPTSPAPSGAPLPARTPSPVTQPSTSSTSNTDKEARVETPPLPLPLPIPPTRSLSASTAAPTLASKLSATALQLRTDPLSLPGVSDASSSKKRVSKGTTASSKDDKVASKPPKNAVRADLLCKSEWLQNVAAPGALESEFRAYWDALSVAEREKWNAESIKKKNKG
ncbi:hypothetical protein EXIGLDRAFT_704700 [Exidia glandulosa HHB12029]|uniref:Uncharacterized protein n=1 Tax=Exidia glandulosa HHB12029 TaxID=1314781 RepID=A0A165AUA1_EXIGL|nr:hypothetical protein EXIGLDRAFT_707131 [Exidia glandulosa HHB12029]KZV80832.1 hypothetical protein EXIGLDRAFT_704700 [Exidia glandulosa HHB12029]